MSALRSVRLLAAITVLLGLFAQAAVADQRFLVEAELWIDGVKRGTPSLLVAALTEASLETGSEDERWRLDIEVEPVDDVFAPSNTLWVHVAVHQRLDDHWDHLVDSIVGVPEGEVATLSLVDGDAPATPETAAVFLRIRASRTN